MTLENAIETHQSKLRQYAAEREAVGSRRWLAHRPNILERSAQKVGQQPESSARVGAKVIGAPLSMRPRVRDTGRAYHGATRGAPWHVPTAVRSARRGEKGQIPKRGLDIKKGIRD